MLCCDSALCWKARRRATGEDITHHSTTAPQPLKPQHALKHHTTWNCSWISYTLITQHAVIGWWGWNKIWSHWSAMWLHHTEVEPLWTDETTARGHIRHALHTGEHTTSCSMQIYSPLSGELSPVSLSHNKEWWWWMVTNMISLTVTWKQVWGDSKIPTVWAWKWWIFFHQSWNG